jgi:hypothetical protein
MATPRNLAIGLIRRAGYTKFAATIRKIKHDTALLTPFSALEIRHDQPERLLRDALDDRALTEIPALLFNRH